MSEIFNAELLAATIRMTAPLLLVALGGLMCQRAEIFNVGLEGCMLSGAFSPSCSYILQEVAW